MNKKNLLLVIDMQNDFCKPAGALYVPGAENDVKNLARFISEKSDELDGIILLQDIHQVIDISHPLFWQTKNGGHPAPFSNITSKEIEDGSIKPLFGGDKALQYLKKLEKQAQFPHTIWPEHCLEGGEGAAIVAEIMNVVNEWAAKGNFYKVIQKGKNPYTEHFGALKANIPDSTDPSTSENKELLSLLEEYDNIYIGGEAESHCVAFTIAQICEYPHLAKRLIVLKNCMSMIPGFEHLAEPIYAQLNPKQFINV